MEENSRKTKQNRKSPTQTSVLDLVGVGEASRANALQQPQSKTSLIPANTLDVPVSGDWSDFRRREVALWYHGCNSGSSSSSGIPCRTLPLLLFIGEGVFTVSAYSQIWLPGGSESADLMSPPPHTHTDAGGLGRRRSLSPMVNKQDVLSHKYVPDDGSFSSQRRGERKGCGSLFAGRL